MTGGLSDAANNIGTACWNGEIGDRQAALEWYKLAAEKGHVEAQLNYAESLLAIGDTLEAIKYYRYAVEQGELKAAHALTRIYKDGVKGVVEVDSEKSQQWANLTSTLNFEQATSYGNEICDITLSPARNLDMNSTLMFNTPRMDSRAIYSSPSTRDRTENIGNVDIGI